MSLKLNLGLSLVAGLLGGFMSYSLFPRVLHAQEQAPAPKTITAERFILKNEQGTTVGVFGLKDGKANITLFDSTGRVIWSTEVRPTTVRH
ncbi:MAG: hypothetical protein WAN14_13020 [Candidatus Acidiferrales bacterium]